MPADNPSPPLDDGDDAIADLRRRIELLEDENQRLRQKLEPLLGGPENPCFDPPKFQRLLQRYLLVLLLPVYLVAIVVPLGVVGRRFLPPMNVAGLPLFDVA